MENFPSSFSQIRTHTSNTYREARHKVFGSATYPSSGLRAALLTRSGSYLVEWPATVGNVVVLNHIQKQITFFSSLKKNNTSQYVQNFRAYEVLSYNIISYDLPNRGIITCILQIRKQ